MSFVVDTKDLERVRKMLAGVPHGSEKAVANAINKSARTAVTGVIKGLRKNYTVNSKHIRKNGFNIKRANAGNLAAVITIRGRVLGLNNFFMTPKEPAREIPFARVKKGGGGSFPGAFVARMKSGHVGIFQRLQDGTHGNIKKYMQGYKPRAKRKGNGQTKGRASISEFYGPSASYMAKNPEIHADMTLDVKNTFETELSKQIGNILKKE